MSEFISTDAFVAQYFPGDRTKVADGWACTWPSRGTADSLRVREIGDEVAVGCFTRDCPGNFHEALGMTAAKWMTVLDTVGTSVAEEQDEATTADAEGVVSREAVVAWAEKNYRLFRSADGLPS